MVDWLWCIEIQKYYVFFYEVRKGRRIPIYLGKSIYVKMFIMGVVSYGVVALLEYRRIQKIPMDTALKNVE